MARQGDNYYLVISDAVNEDSGVYLASAANSSGEAKSYGRLTVSQQMTSSDGMTTRSVNVETTSSGSAIRSNSSSGQPPEFKKLFYDFHAKMGESVRLDATVLGSPKPRVINHC